MSVSIWILLLAITLAFMGAVVQGVIGFGMGVLASPILALAEPSLVPVAAILGSVAMPVFSLIDEHRHLDWRAVGWVMAGTVPATVIGVWLVASLPTRALQATIAIIVLAMVVLNLVRIRISLNAGTLMAAGFISGVSGTASGIGGPPVAIVLANEHPATVRSTLAATFIFATATSLTGLALGGAMTSHAVWVGLAMIPATIVGMITARRLRGRLSPRAFRIGVLVLSSVAATLLLGQALL